VEEGRQGWFNFLFEKFPRCARHDKVVGISHEVDFVASSRHRWDGLLQAVQCEIGQQWGDQAALRGTGEGRKQLVLFPVAGLEPGAEHCLVHRDMREQPLLADFIEASPDVALQHPGGTGFAGEHFEALLQGIGTTPAFAKAIGVSVRQSLGYGGEGKRVERLHSPVVQGGDAQGAQFAVGLGDVNAAQGPGSVSVTFEAEGSLEFLSIGSPDYVIYTGRFSTPVRRDPMHGQEFGRARVSQDPLQGLHLAPVSCLCGLGNTHLQPPNLLPDVGPINGFPRQRWWGGRRIS